jgi:hypothetical protein
MRVPRFGRHISQVVPPLSLLALFSLVAISLAATPAGASPYETVRRTLSGDQVAVHNLVGNLTVVRGGGASVVAEISLRGRDAGRLRIEDGRLRGKSTLRVIYPFRQIHMEDFGGKSTFWVREDGTLDGRTGEGHQVVMSGRAGGSEAAADVKLYVPPGKDVDVFWGNGAADVRDVNASLSIEGAGMNVTASGGRGSLHVSVGSGGIRVTRGTGQVSIETGSGDVELDDLRGEDLSVETGSGTIRLSGLDAPSLRLETGSGDIEARAVRAIRAALETGSGSVSLLLDVDVETLSVESGSGDLDLSVPRGFGAAVHMETGSGEIETSVPMEVRKRGRHEVSGTIGDGRGRLSLSTGSGSIAVRSAAR